MGDKYLSFLDSQKLDLNKTIKSEATSDPHHSVILTDAEDHSVQYKIGNRFLSTLHGEYVNNWVRKYTAVSVNLVRMRFYNLSWEWML